MPSPPIMVRRIPFILAYSGSDNSSGSIIARIVFQPIEETLRLFFSRILGTDSKTQASVQQAVDTLHTLLAIQAAFSLVFVVFGTAYLPILLPLLLPRQYLSTSAPSVLAAWVWYIPVLALNGGLEAFHSSVASPKDLNAQSRFAILENLSLTPSSYANRWMIVFSAIFIISATFLYHHNLGDASLVYANTINLCARVAYSLIFAVKYFNSTSSVKLFRWYHCLPPMLLWFACGASFVCIYLSERHFGANEVALRLGRKALVNISVLYHVVIGTCLVVVCLGTWWTTAGRYMNIPLRRKVE